MASSVRQALGMPEWPCDGLVRVARHSGQEERV